MGSKWFEVTIQAVKTIVVEVPDDWEPEEDRQDLATSFAMSEGIHDSTCDCTVDYAQTQELITAYDIELAKHHADEVFHA